MENSAHMPGPWVIDKHALAIWAPSEKGGETKIFDIRGWGYLTGLGHGALGLPHEEAKAIQTANGRLAAAAPEYHAFIDDLANRSIDGADAGPEAELDKIIMMARVLLFKTTGVV